MGFTCTPRVAALTAGAMVAFAANSVLNRLALADGAADPVAYTGIRLASGALMLALILWYRGSGPRWGRFGGTALGALALIVYALAFSLAYLALEAGTGALLLFGSVQAGMIGWAIAHGDRPGPLEWTGLLAAMLCLGLLVRPGLAAPDAVGSLLMVLAGLSWAAYTLIGRESAAPLVDTSGNFIRCLPLSAMFILPGLWSDSMSPAGTAYAVASGALASGLGYAVWYSVLPGLDRSAAAFVQMTVPALAAFGGVIFIAEPMTLRLALCSIGILGGVGLAVWGAERRRRRTVAVGAAD